MVRCKDEEEEMEEAAAAVDTEAEAEEGVVVECRLYIHAGIAPINRKYISERTSCGSFSFSISLSDSPSPSLSRCLSLSLPRSSVLSLC